MKHLFSSKKCAITQTILSILCLLALFMGSNVASADIKIVIYQLTDNIPGEKLGTVTARDTEAGLVFAPNISGLEPGSHGFHIHQYASCLNGGAAAGGHFDPESTLKHLGPNGHGHLGDLPPLTVDANGQANIAVIASRLQEKDLHAHSLIIHANGDNFSDEPLPFGGGGAGIACGLIPS